MRTFNGWLRFPLNHVTSGYVKDAARDLALYNRPVDQEDIAYRLLSGLPDEFRPLRTALMAMRTDSHRLDVTRVSSAILTQEKSIRLQVDSTPSHHLQAHVSLPAVTHSHTLEPQFSRQRLRDQARAPLLQSYRGDWATE